MKKAFLILGLVAVSAAAGGLTAWTVSADRGGSVAYIEREVERTPALGTQFTSYQAEQYPDLTYAAENAVKAVVNIEAIQQVEMPQRRGGYDPFLEFFGIPQDYGRGDGRPQYREQRAGGSGVIISGDGYIVTNTHVLDGAKAVTVTTSDGTEYTGKLVGADAVSDIAVLKIEAQGLTPAEFGDSSSLQVGDDVVSIGNPLGEQLRWTMTNGIISAINRDMVYNGHSMTLLQTNAAINEGNSGGPLINMYGQVIGITNMKALSTGVEGIGFAIPTASIRPIVNALLADGRVSGRVSIGITVGAVSSAASEYYDLPEGLYISAVAEGSDAEKKGIQSGDMLLAVNGQAVTTTYDVSAVKDGLKVGDTVTLTIYRDGKTFDVDVRLVDTNDLS